MADSLYPSFIIDAIRSPIGLHDGQLAAIRPDDLLAQVLSRLIDRNSAFSPDQVEEILLGCAFPEGAQGQLVARAAALLAGLPPTTCATVINRLSGSSLTALVQANATIRMGNAQALVASGIEHMGCVPDGGFNPGFHPQLRTQNYYINQGEVAESLAKEAGISRAAQEQYAISSHEKALEAWESGRYSEEVVPIELRELLVDRDEGPVYPNAEEYTREQPSFLKDGTITASTTARPAIGASAVLLASELFVKEYRLKPRARILSSAVCGVHWQQSGLGPLSAVEMALQRAELTLDNIGAIELHEAFAGQALYVLNRGKWPLKKTNRLGGSLAFGHPVGCTGGRLISTLLNVMEYESLRYGLAATSISGGQGIAVVLERIEE
ncbi:MAG: thiolase family protein [Calditrichia bacterium]